MYDIIMISSRYEKTRWFSECDMRKPALSDIEKNLTFFVMPGRSKAKTGVLYFRKFRSCGLGGGAFSPEYPRFPEKTACPRSAADCDVPFISGAYRGRVFSHRILLRCCRFVAKRRPACFGSVGWCWYGSEKEFPLAAWSRYLQCLGTVGVRRNSQCQRSHWIFTAAGSYQGETTQQRW